MAENEPEKNFLMIFWVDAAHLHLKFCACLVHTLRPFWHFRLLILPHNVTLFTLTVTFLRGNWVFLIRFSSPVCKAAACHPFNRYMFVFVSTASLSACDCAPSHIIQLALKAQPWALSIVCPKCFRQAGNCLASLKLPWGNTVTCTQKSHTQHDCTQWTAHAHNHVSKPEGQTMGNPANIDTLTQQNSLSTHIQSRSMLSYWRVTWGTSTRTGN